MKVRQNVWLKNRWVESEGVNVVSFEDLKNQTREEEVEELFEMIINVGVGDIYRCMSCDLLCSQDDLVEIRECPHCVMFFNGTDHGRNCPDCNRPFSRKVTEMGCMGCEDDSECEELKIDAQTVKAARDWHKKMQVEDGSKS